MILEDKIHFWNFPSNITIKFEPGFRKRFFEDVVKYFKNSKNAGMFLRKVSAKHTKRRTFTGSEIRTFKTTKEGGLYDYCPVWMIVELANKIGHDLKNLETKIIAYRAMGGGGSSIIKPVLPVKVTPEFDSIIAHMMGDGTDKRTFSGAASYSQYDIKNVKQFYQKLINVFGEISPPSFSYSRKSKDVGIPSPIISTIKKHYSIKGFGTFESRVPKQLFTKGKYNKLAFLLAFLVDEGTLYDFISFRLANRKLVKDVRNITISLGYKCSKLLVAKNKVGTIYGFNISNYSLIKMHNDIKKLIKKYPTCDLANKQKNFNYLVSLGTSSRRKRHYGETKKLILKKLEERPRTTLELGNLTGVCRRTARVHLEDLQRIKKVKIKNIKPKGTKIWCLCDFRKS